jgi:CheY-like chemotaxis protein
LTSLALCCKTIVLSDDETSTPRNVQHVLQDAGFENIHCAHEVDDTLELVRRLEPDLLVTDVLKGMDHEGGAKIARACKADPFLTHVPILLFTVFPDPSVFDPALFAECLGKPCRQEEILEAIRTLLS